LPTRPWNGAKNIIANASDTVLTTLAVAGFRQLGAAYIQSPTALGILGRTAVHVAGGIVALIAIDEMIIYIHKQL